MTTILVIEDESPIRETILVTLRRNGYRALGASNGAEGIEVARKELPDLIISDVRMEEVDGFQTLSEIRKDALTASIPFILITAEQGRDTMRLGMELGADDFLSKPFTTAELLAAVKARLEKHEKLMKKAESKLEQLRAQLSATLPHELRTPLNGVLGYADILRKQFAELEPIEVSQMAERIYKNAKRLHRLVENFLLYAQLEVLGTDAQKVESLRTSRTNDVGKVIDALARQRAYESGRTADLDLQIATADVAISPDNLSKIFEELFDNALRYSKKGSPVQVSSSTNGTLYHLHIRDQGRGMTPEQLHEIGAYMQFERKIYEQQGSGLGLTVAKRLTELHGGSLAIESEYGKGTELKLTFPIAPGDSGPD